MTAMEWDRNTFARRNAKGRLNKAELRDVLKPYGDVLGSGCW
jgi:hypothetical protein